MNTKTNFIQQVGVPHCNFCHKCHNLLIGGTSSIICNDGGVIYTVASEPTPCTSACRMYDGTPVLKEKNFKTDNEREKEFFERFGANKIWVTPSRDNVETILEIHSFLRRALRESYEQGYAARGGVESAQKQRMFEAGKELGRKELINFWIQDIDRQGGGEKHTKAFREAVHKKICKRGNQKI